MNKDLPIWIMEPEPSEKWNLWTKKFYEGRQNTELITEGINVEDIKQQLKEVRQYSSDNINKLVEELKENLAQKYPQVTVKSASDSAEAVNYIKEISDGISNVSVNNSRAITQELKPGLIENGLTIIDSYYDEIDAEEIEGKNYWELPQLLGDNITGAFEVTEKMSGLKSANADGIKEYLAVLGVNAVSADDSTVFFLQHFRNIYNDLKQAKKVILIIGLDKIARNREDAAFQTKCVGIFGAENMLLGIHPKTEKTISVADLPVFPGKEDRELHIIILDNDRTSLLQSEYKDYFLCIDCRSCTGTCPANLSGKPLSPKELVFNFKKYLPQVSPDLLQGKAEKFPDSSDDDSSGEIITEDAVWACTTCHACQEVCPVGLEHTNAIIDLRRNLVMVSTSQAARDPLRNIRQRGHPWTGTTLAREDWVEGLDVKILAEDSNVDVLYWVGCTEALEDRCLKIAQAMGKLMNKAGVNFGILGEDESCCGDPARRLGNEYQFQLQAQKNIKMFNEYNIKKIVTACPHCYNTIKNEYPQFGGEYEVVHHTEFIEELIKEGKLKVDEVKGGVITYQDPCYLGRYNDIYDAPRQILEGIPGAEVVEMEQNRERSFCCGGGGGRAWLEESTGERIGDMRAERAIETKAETIATACPFCLQMFEDGVKAKGAEETVKVRDIAEILAEQQ
ncbi:(Fe-S)-binding protein [Chloroflexota bacterium]